MTPVELSRQLAKVLTLSSRTDIWSPVAALPTLMLDHVFLISVEVAAVHGVKFKTGANHTRSQKSVTFADTGWQERYCEYPDR